MNRKSILKFFLSSFVPAIFFLTTPSFAQEQFPYLAQVVSEPVNIRAGQNENFEKIGKLKKGDQAVVIGRSYAWDKIKLPVSAESYVNEGLLTDLGDGIGMAKSDRVNIRAGKNTTYAVLGQLKKGALVRIIERQDGWFKIEPPEGSSGWVSTKYLQFVSQEIPAARAVELPKKNVASDSPPVAQNPAEETKELTGTVEAIGEQPVSTDIRYKLITDDQQTFFLQAQGDVLDGFLHAKVKVEGKVLPEINIQYPVISVTKINLLF